MPFVKEQGRSRNVVIGGRDVVVHWDDEYESLGVWYNDLGELVKDMSFFGQSDIGMHKRVEYIKAGLFYAMWMNFYPSTDVNRAKSKTEWLSNFRDWVTKNSMCVSH